MDYKLARHLKDMGFPQHKFCDTCPYMAYCIPTLEELIEACGNRNLLLEGVVAKTAGGSNVILYWVCQVGRSKAQGDTPSKALARLWLALQTKPKIQ